MYANLILLSFGTMITYFFLSHLSHTLRIFTINCTEKIIFTNFRIPMYPCGILVENIIDPVKNVRYLFYYCVYTHYKILYPNTVICSCKKVS